MRRAEITAALAAAAAAVLVAAVIVFAPLARSCEQTASSRGGPSPEVCSDERLAGNEPWIATLVAGIAAVALTVCACSLVRTRLRPDPRPLMYALTAGLALFAVISAASIGILLMPPVILLALACVFAARQPRVNPSASPSASPS